MTARGGADQHGLAARARGEDAQIERCAIERRVLGVENQDIELAERQHFGDVGVRRLDPGAGQQLARHQALAEGHHRFRLARAAPSASVASLA